MGTIIHRTRKRGFREVKAEIGALATSILLMIVFYYLSLSLSMSVFTTFVIILLLGIISYALIREVGFGYNHESS